MFLLDHDLDAAARSHVNRHVVKMPLEAAQLLCSALPPGLAPYRSTHLAHPLAVWTRATIANYRFVAAYGLAIADEYARRYRREHASRAVALRCLDIVRPEHVPDGDLLEPVQVVPEDCQVPGDHVAAYRAYYVRDKARLASWRAPAERPAWWPITEDTILPREIQKRTRASRSRARATPRVDLVAL